MISKMQVLFQQIFPKHGLQCLTWAAYYVEFARPSCHELGLRLADTPISVLAFQKNVSASVPAEKVKGKFQVVRRYACSPQGLDYLRLAVIGTRCITH